ncbi:MAG: hypothetical protein QXU09_03490 [Thermoproteota archaeon]
MKEILANWGGGFGYIGGACLYILKSGGTDFTTGAISGADTPLNRISKEATQPDVVLLTVSVNAPTQLQVTAKNTILDAGDQIKIIITAGSTAPSTGAVVWNIWISGDEF